MRAPGALAALREGARRVNRAPAVWLGVWALTVLVSLPLAVAMRDRLQTSLGSSLAANTAASGVNYDWMQEFMSDATGLSSTFKPAVIGFAAVLDNLSAFMDNDRQPVVIVSAAAVYIAGWLFLAGGIIDRYARNRVTHAHGFFAASGVFFFRFLRLAVVMALAYGVLFGALHPWLFGRVFPRLTRELTVERTAFLIRVVLYGVFGGRAGGVQYRVRLREGSRGRRGSPQHDRRDDRRNPVHQAEPRGSRQPVPAGRAALCARAGRLRPRRAGRRQRGLVDLAGVSARTRLRPGPVVGEAGVLGVGDGAFSESARTRRLRRGAGAGVAGIADG